jgi:hypothetical protein
MMDKSVLQRIHALVTATLLIIGLYLEYEVAFNPPSPTQMNESMVVTVLIILGLYAVYEYLHL